MILIWNMDFDILTIFVPTKSFHLDLSTTRYLTLKPFVLFGQVGYVGWLPGTKPGQKNYWKLKLVTSFRRKNILNKVSMTKVYVLFLLSKLLYFVKTKVEKMTLIDFVCFILGTLFFFYTLTRFLNFELWIYLMIFFSSVKCFAMGNYHVTCFKSSTRKLQRKKQLWFKYYSFYIFPRISSLMDISYNHQMDILVTNCKGRTFILIYKRLISKTS